MGRPPKATEREGSRATNTRAGAPAEEVAAAAESVTVENLRKELADAQKLRRAADKRALEAEAKVDEQEAKRRKKGMMASSTLDDKAEEIAKSHTCSQGEHRPAVSRHFFASARKRWA